MEPVDTILVQKWYNNPNGQNIVYWKRKFMRNIIIPRCEMIRRHSRSRKTIYTHKRQLTVEYNKARNFVYITQLELGLKEGQKVRVRTFEYSPISSWYCPICFQEIKYGLTGLKRHLLRNTFVQNVKIKNKFSYMYPRNTTPLVSIRKTE